jgi:hypothetical protein
VDVRFAALRPLARTASIDRAPASLLGRSSTDALPDAIVKRFEGKVMAIVGIEMDQVRRTPAGDVSLPINVAYNHHHNTAIVGKGARMEEVAHGDPRVAEAAAQWPPRRGMMLSDRSKLWLPIEHTPSASGAPTSAMFDDANGGEYRKSWSAIPTTILTTVLTTVSG